MDEERERTAAYVRRAFDRARYERGLTKKDAAARLSVSTGHISHWCKGRSPIPDDRLLELAILLDFNPLEIRPTLAKYRELWRAEYDPQDALILAAQELDKDSRDALLVFVRNMIAAKGKGEEPTD